MTTARFQFGRHLVAVVAAILATHAAHAQQAAQGPKLRPVGATVATASVTFTNITQIRHLSDGRILVNDPIRRLVTMLDANLANATIVVDSAAGKENSYGMRAGGLIPFRGDSTLYFDATSSTFLVIDPAGKIARVTTVPSGITPASINAGTFFSAGLGVVYRATAPFRMPVLPPDGGEVTVKSDDSAFVVAVNVANRSADTLGVMITGTRTMTASAGRMSMTSAGGLYPVSDQFAVTSDGAIAILRAREYRIDWINPDKTRTAGPRIPFNWRRLNDEVKIQIIDSINTTRKKAHDDRVVQWVQDSTDVANGKPISRPNAAGGPGRGGDVAASRAGDVTMVGRAGGGGALPPGAAVTRVLDGEMIRMAGPAQRPAPPPYAVISEVPDYMPAVTPGAGTILGDGDNNLWIRLRPDGPVTGGAIYDVVDRKGELIDRVQLPAARTLAGFGPNGAVYLLARDAGTTKLERVRFK